MLTTLLSPTSGSAEVGGYDIIESPGKVRRRIGYVSQLVSADGALTGYENLRLSAKLYGPTRAERGSRIADALDIMPSWLRVIAQVNPLTYLIDALRGLMIKEGESVHGYAVDFAVMLAVFALLLFIAVRLYPTLAE